MKYLNWDDEVFDKSDFEMYDLEALSLITVQESSVN